MLSPVVSPTKSRSMEHRLSVSDYSDDGPENSSDENQARPAAELLDEAGANGAKPVSPLAVVTQRKHRRSKRRDKTQPKDASGSSRRKRYNPILTNYISKEIKEMDANFFESFASLQCKVENRRSEIMREEDKASLTLSERATGLKAKPSELCKVSKRERDLIYVEVLYTIKHKIGATTASHTPFDFDMYAYAKEAFGMSDADHAYLLMQAKEEKPPITVLNVEVLEARDLIAKDADGFSDPYAMLGIIPAKRLIEEFEPQSPEKDDAINVGKNAKGQGDKLNKRNRMGGSFRRKKDKPIENIPAKFIKATSVKYNTLNPQWNEKFKFDLDDPQNDRLHLDIWDHDDEEKSVVDAVKKLNEISSFKGLERYFKQVAQSARTGESDSVDDFLGCVTLKLQDMPSVGLNEWFKLEGRSAKSDVSGQVHLKMALATREDRGLSEEDDIMNEIKQHVSLMRIFTEFDMRNITHESDKWAGKFSPAAVTILHQHAIQGDITPVQQTMCQWLALSKIQNDVLMDFDVLYKCLADLNSKSLNSSLSHEEEEMLAESFSEFLAKSFDRILKHREVFAASKDGLLKLRNALRCIGFLQKSELFQRCLPFYKDSTAEIKQLIKVLASPVEPYLLCILGCNPKIKSASMYCEKAKREIWANSTDDYSNLVELTCRLNAISQRAVDFYHKPFMEELGINYFWLTYREFDRLLTTEFISQHVTPDDLSSVDGLHGAFELYLALAEFVGFRTHLETTEQEKLERLQETDFAKWFYSAFRKWLSLAKEKSQQRVDLALKLDRPIPLSDKSELKQSTSYIDVCYCYQQMTEFWRHLSLPQSDTKLEFMEVLTQNMCKLGAYYADHVFAMLAHSNFYDETQSLSDPIVDQFCIAVNNVEHVRRVLKELPDLFHFEEVVDKNKPDDASAKLKLYTPVKDINAEITEQIEMAVNRFAEKQKGNMQKDIFHLAWSADGCSIDKAVQPLLDHLDKRLLSYHKWLLHGNFLRLLSATLRVVLSEIEAMATENEGMDPNFYRKLFDGMAVLTEFFNAGGKGISMEQIKQQPLYKKLSSLLQMNQKPTVELINLHFLNLLKEEVTINLYYSSPNLNVVNLTQNVNAQGVIPLDSNGLSDPFVIVEIVPHQRFPQCKPVKTRVVPKTLNPAFEENFEFPLQLSQLPKVAMLYFIVMDHDFLVTNDFAGEAFLDLDDVPGIKLPTGGILAERVQLKPFTLTLIHPEPKSSQILEVLEKRRNDRDAQEFIRHVEAIKKT